MGTSKTAEAFLLYAAHDPRLDAIVALAPSHVAWANVGRGLDEAERLGTIPGPQVSQWS